MKKIAVILSGCGNRDGSELQETLSLLLAIDRRGWQYQCFAPEGFYDVVNHASGVETVETRDIFVESARIARGNIRMLSEYRPADYDALALPGGMGAARNLSTYAYDGAEMSVMDSVEDAVLAAVKAEKPVCAMCIAPMVLAKVLGKKGVEITLGSDQNDAAQAARRLGAKTQACGPTDVCVDERLKVITTPAYMAAGRISEIFDGAENMVSALTEFLG